MLTLVSAELARLGRDIRKQLDRGILKSSEVSIAYMRFHDAATNDKVHSDEIPLKADDPRMNSLYEAEARLKDVIEY